MDKFQGFGKALGHLLNGRFKSTFRLYTPNRGALWRALPEINVTVQYSRERRRHKRTNGEATITIQLYPASQLELKRVMVSPERHPTCGVPEENDRRMPLTRARGQKLFAFSVTPTKIRTWMYVPQLNVHRVKES